MIRIGVDVDGTLNYSLTYALEVTGKKVNLRNLTSLYLDFLPLRQVREMVLSEEFYAVPRPNLIAREVLRSIPCEIHIVTARPEVFYQLTLVWLEHNRYKFHRLALVQDKAEYARENKLQCFVEDNLDNAKQIAHACRVLLLDKPYNKGSGERIIRASSWSRVKQVLDYLEYARGV